MGRRLGLMATIVLVVGTTHANNPFPAVDLPSAVPDSVRDQTARALAATRDQLGWAIHPFRGEFHGLGLPAGGESEAYDLSANGRVVVGADYDTERQSEGFVWTPWTGRAIYNLLPNGAEGQATPMAISADGVYVVGNIQGEGQPDSVFKWSLVGREWITSPDGHDLTASSISGDGSVIAGAVIKPIEEEDLLADQIAWDSGGPNFTPVPYTPVRSRAFKHTTGHGLAEVGVSPSGTDSEAVDISADSQQLVSNAHLRTYNRHGIASPRNQVPFLWDSEESIALLGHPSPSPEPMDIYNRARSVQTAANAISADGSTVVGFTQGTALYSPYNSAYSIVSSSTAAAIWREDQGWTTLLPSVRLADHLGYSGPRYPSGRVASAATDVSGDGALVVGRSWDASYWPILTSVNVVNIPILLETPFLWDEQRGMRDLADVLRLDYGLDLGDWDLREATAISDDGTTIVGNGVNPEGVTEAWRAVLHRETPDGDIDFDGDVDQHDYAALMANLGRDSDASAIFYADGDLNADGLVDQADSAAMLGLYDYRYMGDFNADGLVNLADYTVWRDHVGRFTGGLADSNGDGWVNDLDLAAWRTHYGDVIASLVPHAVPEPGGVVGVLLGVAVLGLRGRR